MREGLRPCGALFHYRCLSGAEDIDSGKSDGQKPGPKGHAQDILEIGNRFEVGTASVAGLPRSCLIIKCKTMKKVQFKMKRVRINAGKVGLVFRRGDYQRVLTHGTHWVGLRHLVMMYDLSKEFIAPIALELLLQDKNLEALLHVLEVKDSELLLVSENGNLKRVLMAGALCVLENPDQSGVPAY